MKHGSLFSGIGGFDLAAQWMGWDNVFHCECNEFAARHLKYYWPNAIHYNDITQTDFTFHRGGIDVLTGGFPCQPYSNIGEQKGTADERHLWPHMLRAVREIKPRWVVGENVRGLVNWNGGLVFEEVQADLEAAGYEVLPFLLPAAGIGAAHRRDRIWFVAHAIEGRLEGRLSSSKERQRQTKNRPIPALVEDRDWTERARSIVHAGVHGVPSQLDGITVSEWRKQTIAAAGNAVVPQVVLQIFKAIEQYEQI